MIQTLAPASNPSPVGWSRMWKKLLSEAKFANPSPRVRALCGGTLSRTALPCFLAALATLEHSVVEDSAQGKGQETCTSTWVLCSPLIWSSFEE